MNGLNLGVLIGIACHAATVAAAVTGPQSQPGESATSAPAVSEAVFAVDAEIAQAWQQQLEALRANTERAGTPVEKAAAHVALANRLLSEPTREAATRWLVGWQKPEDLALIRRYAEEAGREITSARKLLEAKPSEEQSRLHSDVSFDLDLVEPFARLLTVISADRDPAAAGDEIEEAALDLALARESDDPVISSGALLWQSFALMLAGRRDRALVALPEALAEVKPETYDFYCRLLRCRLLADEHQYAASMALLLQIGGSIEKWYRSRDERSNMARERLVGIVELFAVAKPWHAQLRSQGNAAAADRLQSLVADIQKDLFGGEPPHRVDRLRHTIPLIARSDTDPAEK